MVECLQLATLSARGLGTPAALAEPGGGLLCEVLLAGDWQGVLWLRVGLLRNLHEHLSQEGTSTHFAVSVFESH